MKINKNSVLRTNSIINGKSLVLIVLAAGLIFSLTGPVQAQEKTRLARRIANDWIKIGKTFYERGSFIEAEQALLNAQDYERFLSEDEKQELGTLIERVHFAQIERETVEAHLKQIEELVDQGSYAQARQSYEKIRGSEALTDQERKKVTQMLAEEQVTQRTPQSREMISLFNRSVQLYNEGQLEEAREGFVKVDKSGVMVSVKGKTAEDFLTQIDSILLQKAQLQIQPEEPNVIPEIAKPQEMVEPSAVPQRTEPGSKQNLLRSFAIAVIDDTLVKINSFIEQGNFEQARKSIEIALQVVRENRDNLGEQLYQQYIGDLRQLTKDAQDAQRAASQKQEQDNLEQLKKQQEQLIETLTGQAIENIQQGQYDKAIELLERLKEIKS